LDPSNREEALGLLDELHTAVVESRALLMGTYFTGSANALTDPFTLPAGTYRVTMRTEGSAWVRAIHVAAPDDYEYLLLVGEATNGASAMYVADGGRIMLEFAVVDAPYELWFEEI
jgi:hypothetical protein